jgi:hypothetical protein
MREVVAEFRKPGDAVFHRQGFSAVMLHLALKAFYPGKPAVPAACTSIPVGSFSEMIPFSR